MSLVNLIINGNKIQAETTQTILDVKFIINLF